MCPLEQSAGGTSKTEVNSLKMSQFFADTHTILELDLSKRDVLHRLVPLVLSYACVFMIYHHIRDVRTLQRLYIIYSHSKE